MTYLITGGTGANGSEVVRELVEMGEKPVIFDIAPNLKLINDIANQVKIISGDVLDFNQLLHTIKNEKIDRVIHRKSVV